MESIASNRPSPALRVTLESILSPAAANVSADTQAPLEDLVSRALLAIPDERQRLTQVMNFFDSSTEAYEYMLEVNWELWRFAVRERLWQAQFKSEDEFKEAIGYEFVLKRMLEQRQITHERSVSHYLNVSSPAVSWRAPRTSLTCIQSSQRPRHP